MKVPISLWTFALAALFWSNTLARAETRSVTAVDRRAGILQSLNAFDTFKKAVRGKRTLLASMTEYEQPATRESEATTVVETLHYNYDTGRTVRSLFDPKRNRLLSVESRAAYPTPLTEEELAEARQLAREKSDQVRTLFQQNGAESLEELVLVPVVSDARSPLFGKRLVFLTYIPRERPRQRAMVRVNLTDKTVEPMSANLQK